MNIIWKGNQYTNSDPRVDGKGQSYVPCAIVDHITDGTASSVDDWFTSDNNNESSTHFMVLRNGEIHQYVQIERMAWGNGLDIQHNLRAATAPIVYDKKVNPNLYTVSIEHEGYTGNGRDGTLTEAQFQASVWLHFYIRDYVVRKWGVVIPLDSYHVIGHCHINKESKPNCPGPSFPWQRLYAALNGGEVVSAPIQGPELAFSDVPAGSWYENAIKVVASPQYSFMTGYGDGTFRPDQPVTRAELAKVLNDLIYWVEHR